VGDRIVPLPITPLTLEALYDQVIPDMAAWLAQHRSQESPTNAGSAARTRVGPDLFELLFRGYTEKMWGRTAEELGPSLTERIPVRLTPDDRYFDDVFQAMPSNGYAEMVRRMLGSVTVSLGVEWSEVARDRWEHVVFTGPLDEYFGCVLGRLPYRSLRFEYLTRDPSPIPHPASTLNQPSVLVPWIRETDQRRLSGGGEGQTEILREYPAEDGDPMYPIPMASALDLRASYKRLADKEAGVSFAGRLGAYQYWNMDQVVANGLAVAESVP